MLCLGVFYVAAGRAVHRHGADHRLHRRDHDAVPVRADAGRPGRLRLADRDAARPAGRRDRCSALGFAGLVGTGAATGRWTAPTAVGLDRGQRRAATCRASPRLLFTKYVFAFEVTSALLITAAVGAMMLAHIERRKEDKVDQPRPMQARFAPGQLPGRRRPARASSPPPTSVATPARLPDGRLSERSISAILPTRELTAGRGGAEGHRRKVAENDARLLPRPGGGRCSPSARSAC